MTEIVASILYLVLYLLLFVGAVAIGILVIGTLVLTRLYCNLAQEPKGRRP